MPRYAVLEFEPLLDSSSIDSAGWTEIAQTIYRNYQLFDGFVVLHGTDSLAYTGSALSFMLQNLGKPVILTGTLAPSSSSPAKASKRIWPKDRHQNAALYQEE
jgi:60kDa lysophospholipase